MVPRHLLACSSSEHGIKGLWEGLERRKRERWEQKSSLCTRKPEE